MKKSFIFIFLILFSFMFININQVNASQSDYMITEEIVDSHYDTYININYDQSDMFILLDKMNFKKDIWADFIYKGYIDLNINKKNQFEIELKNTLSNLYFFADKTNINDMYFLLDFENINTNVDGLFKSDSINITNITNTQLKYQLDFNNLSITNLFFNIWYASISNPADPVDTVGSIRLKSIKLYLEFKEPVNTLKDVKSDYNQLPNIDNKFIIIDKMELIDLTSRSYKMFFKYGVYTYAFDLSFPSDIDLSKIYNNNGDLNISYSSNLQDKFLYIQPEPNLEPYPIIEGTLENPGDLLVGFITIYLSKKDENGNLKYDVIKKLQFECLVEKSYGGLANMYMFFDIPIEKIINISVKFDYRYRYFGFKDVWKTTYNIYAWDDVVEINFPWWTYLSPISAACAKVIDWTNVLNVKDTIKKQSINDLSDNVITRYQNDFNGDITKLDDLTIYKVYLGQFTTFGATNFDIRDDYTINELTYLYEGIIYKVPYDKMEQKNKGTPGNEDEGSIWNFPGFFGFAGVKGLDDFFLHLVIFWKESIVVIGTTYVVIKMLLSLKRKRY